MLMTKYSEIKFIVALDGNNIPEKIDWSATDAGFKGSKECKSIMISLWDKAESATFGFDLWTKEMMVDEMNIFFHQVLIKMSDTYRRATKNSEAADMIDEFSKEFAEKVKLDEQSRQG